LKRDRRTRATLWITIANPPPSTVKADGARIGALSAQALLDRLNGDESAERIVNTGFELIQRGST